MRAPLLIALTIVITAAGLAGLQLGTQIARTSLAVSACPPLDTGGDGWSDSDEALIGTDPAWPCGNTGWPADLLSSGASANKLDLLDMASFVAPVRRLGTSPVPPPGDPN